MESRIHHTIATVRVALEAALGPGSVAIHRHNHTGTGKLSFEVRAGGEHMWARVAANDNEDRHLRVWASVATLLTDLHCAPPLLEVLDVAGRTRLLFPFLEDPVATRRTLSGRYAEMRAVLDGLHADGDLVEHLGGPTTSSASYRDVWVARFETDLRIIAGRVAPAVYEYLAGEVEALASLVDSLELEVHSAIHGDPWHENVLMGPERIWLLDWEDLMVGDPVIDHAILLMDAHGSDSPRWPSDERHQVARRALMLDAAVDGAADWVENSDPEIRASKEKQYLEALAAYRADVT